MIPIAVCSVKAALCVFIKWIYKKSLWLPAGGIIIARYNLVLPGELSAGFQIGTKLRNPAPIGCKFD
jgi:hypothetical protein